MAKISWAGQLCFEISVSNSRDHEANILIDPMPKTFGDILLATNGYDKNIPVKGEPFVIDSPGEYEVKGVFVRGIPAGENTIYIMEAEDIKFCHLGNLSQQLTDEQLEKIDTVDILMVSDSDEAKKIIAQIEPKIVIPMDFSSAEKFLKTMGKPSVAPVDKLSIKAKDLPKEGAMEIAVLKS